MHARPLVMDTTRHAPTAATLHCIGVGSQSSLKNLGSHIDASHSRQPLVKGERLVRYEVNAVMHFVARPLSQALLQKSCLSHAKATPRPRRDHAQGGGPQYQGVLLSGAGL